MHPTRYFVPKIPLFYLFTPGSSFITSLGVPATFTKPVPSTTTYFFPHPFIFISNLRLESIPRPICAICVISLSGLVLVSSGLAYLFLL